MRSLDRPLRGLAVYNPDLLSKEELILGFVARRPLLEDILSALRRPDETQHRLLIGQRGMGKTTLLRRIYFGIEDDPELRRRWLPLAFREEQYNIVRLSDFYMNCVDALGDTLDRSGQGADASTLDGAVSDLAGCAESERATGALALLLGTAERLGKRLLLLVDSLEIVLDRLDSSQWKLRKLLQSETRLVVIGASASSVPGYGAGVGTLSETLHDYGAPFYDFFRVHELGGLSIDETRILLSQLAEIHDAPGVAQAIESDPARLRTIHTLAGGNPRTLVLLFQVLAQATDGDVRTDLEQLLDRVTPLYKHRFEALATQAQQIVDALAIHWDPLNTAELAKRVGLDPNVVSSQLARLGAEGMVEKVRLPEKRAGYQLAERFFNVWYLMRASRRVRQRLAWLVEFLRMLYGHDELRKHARGRLGARAGGPDPIWHAEYDLALARAVEDTPLRRALETEALRGLADRRDLRAQLGNIVDLEGDDAELRPIADRLRIAAENCEKVRAARLSWAGWDAEHFADLLGGSIWLSLDEKARIARSLDELGQTAIEALERRLTQEHEGMQAVCRSEVVARDVRGANRGGYLRDSSDVEGARAAAEKGFRGALIVALTMRADQAPTEELAAELRASLQQLDCAVGRVGLGRALAGLGRYDEAEEAYRQAIALDSEYAHAWIQLGDLVRVRFAKYDEAERAYRAAIRHDPKDPQSWSRLARLLHFHLERYADAERAYRAAIELDDTDVSVWSCLGNLLHLKLEQYELAECAYRVATELDPKSAFPWVALGGLYQLHLEKHELAEKAHRAAIDLDPKIVLPWLGLAELLAHTFGRNSEAEETYRRGILELPDEPALWNGLAWVRYLEGKIDESTEDAARRAHSLDASNHAYQHTLATILVCRGRWDEPAELARGFIREGSASFHEEIWSDIVRFFAEAAKRGRTPDAVRLLDELGMAERWKPLREALQALAEGPEVLLRLAPEVRGPAEQILTDLSHIAGTARPPKAPFRRKRGRRSRASS